MNRHGWPTRRRHPPLSKINSRFTPPVGVGGLSAENQKNDAALDEIARQEIYAKFGLNPTIGIGGGYYNRAPATPPGMRVRTGRFKKLRS